MRNTESGQLNKGPLRFGINNQPNLLLTKIRDSDPPGDGSKVPGPSYCLPESQCSVTSVRCGALADLNSCPCFQKLFLHG
ncbi:hypothetical protein EWB00_000588 [Schistosoma japonicum]|uniref:Uncharacterized protein n=1 Tax=Schistosoma japonicum TaxID=6182 RepID=A0A4Z2CKA1_SCHJA|nr:hypothetical protein EWB00_000588 [Schistosoma japonicum]